MKVKLTALLAAIFLSTTYAQGKSSKVEITTAKDVSIMTYNVENLFDTKHDEGKQDFEFLPSQLKQLKAHKKDCGPVKGFRKKSCLKRNWDEAALTKKMEHLSKVILSVDGGKGPDILILPEIENLEILQRFNKQYLKAAGYKSEVLLEGPDFRGIDVAMLSRLELVGKGQLHRIQLKKSKLKYGGETRPILEAVFKLPNGDQANVFGVHFPSPAHSHGTRVEAFGQLKDLMAKRIGKGEIVVAGGDFNVKAEEDSRIYRQMASDDFYVSHILACSHCLGTNYYRRNDSWSFLDALILHKKSKWQIEPSSVQVVAHPEMVDTKGRPKRFNEKKSVGASDHLPVYMKLRRNP